MEELKPIFVDIETTLLPVWTFRLGKQFVSHGQMIKTQLTDIICITYCFEKGPGKCLTYDVSKGETSAKIIKEFDEIFRSGKHYVVGQNSDRFDVKHINSLRLVYGLEPFPEWADLSEDTLKHVRKHFSFPSNRLDFADKVFGNEGKISMELADWKFIQEYFMLLRIERAAGKKATKAIIPLLYDHSYTQIRTEGAKRYKKMCKYGTKDVVDTRTYFNRIKPYIKPKVNMAVGKDGLACTNCGSLNIKRNGTRPAGKTLYQQFYCNDHGGYAGRASINPNTKQVTGKMK